MRQHINDKSLEFRAWFVACAEQKRPTGNPPGSNAVEQKQRRKTAATQNQDQKGRKKGAYNKNVAVKFLGEPQDCPHI
jgi:hypothetical protein